MVHGVGPGLVEIIGELANFDQASASEYSTRRRSTKWNLPSAKLNVDYSGERIAVYNYHSMAPRFVGHDNALPGSLRCQLQGRRCCSTLTAR
jgi:hypothetical protein